MSLVVIPEKKARENAGDAAIATQRNRPESVWLDESDADAEEKWPVPLRFAFIIGVSLTFWAAVFLGAGWAFG